MPSADLGAPATEVPERLLDLLRASAEARARRDVAVDGRANEEVVFEDILERGQDGGEIGVGARDAQTLLRRTQVDVGLHDLGGHAERGGLDVAVGARLLGEVLATARSFDQKVCNTQLRGDAKARAWLSDDFPAVLDGEGTFEKKLRRSGGEQSERNTEY